MTIHLYHIFYAFLFICLISAIYSSLETKLDNEDWALLLFGCFMGFIIGYGFMKWKGMIP